MRRIILEFLRELREIERRYGQIADTDVREALHEAIMEGYVERRENFSLPPSFEMLSERGDALVRGAVGRFLDAANEESERLGCPEPRDRLLLLRRAEVPRPERTGSYDDFMAGLELSHATPDEPAWSACDDPVSMLFALRRRCSDRKLRLFAAACCRRIWHLLEDERSRRAVATLERYADQEETVEGLAIAAGEAQDAADGRCDENDCHAAGAVAMAVSFDAAADRVGGPEIVLLIELYVTIGVASAAARAPGDTAHGDDEGADVAWAAAVKIEQRAQADLLRDIFGNPFRPVSIDPASLTPVVLELARTIYDKRAFDRLPALAGAIQESGCDNADILSHCRGPGPHARGCWVIDLVLGNS